MRFSHIPFTPFRFIPFSLLAPNATGLSHFSSEVYYTSPRVRKRRRTFFHEHEPLPFVRSVWRILSIYTEKFRPERKSFDMEVYWLSFSYSNNTSLLLLVCLNFQNCNVLSDSSNKYRLDSSLFFIVRTSQKVWRLSIVLNQWRIKPHSTDTLSLVFPLSTLPYEKQSICLWWNESTHKLWRNF